MWKQFSKLLYRTKSNYVIINQINKSFQFCTCLRIFKSDVHKIRVVSCLHFKRNISSSLILYEDEDADLYKYLIDDSIDVTKDEQDEFELDRVFILPRIRPLFGHKVFVIQPRIKWGPKKKWNTTSELQLAEAVTLAETIPDWIVVEKIILNCINLDKKFLFGSGNLKKLKEITYRNPTVSAIFISTYMLTVLQRKSLEKEFQLPIYDRYTVVLHIFQDHARTKQAKLQIALAEIPYLSLTTMVKYISKTSLIKALTGDVKLEPKDQLFATLDVTTHAGRLFSLQKILYVDTIGFISDIPTTLIESFAATLEDMVLSDVIVHVRDISHPDQIAQKDNVLNTLENLNLPSSLLDSIIEVGNKVDLLKSNVSKVHSEALLNDVLLDQEPFESSSRSHKASSCYSKSSDSPVQEKKKSEEPELRETLFEHYKNRNKKKGGKTSLIKALTGDVKLEPKDQLFATLDVTTHAGRLFSLQKILYVDTIGFISDIPTTLIESFAATLEDMVLSDVIVHVRDISHPDQIAQKDNVLNTLENLNLPSSLLDSIIEVGNKVDLLKSSEREKDLLYISATRFDGLDILKKMIEDKLMENTGRLVKVFRVPSGGMEMSNVSKVRSEALLNDVLLDQEPFESSSRSHKASSCYSKSSDSPVQEKKKSEEPELRETLFEHYKNRNKKKGGKTSLIKALTGDVKLEPKDQLFATLDVTTHAGRLFSLQKILYVDTIGFISDIPTTLIESFAATLEDMVLSDVIVHVRDISHPDQIAQKDNVLNTLENLNLPSSLLDSIIEVGNKVDLLKSSEREKDLLYISATRFDGLDILKKMIEDKLMENTGRLVKVFRVPSGGMEMRWLYKEANVKATIADTTDPNFLLMEVVISQAVLSKYIHNFGNSAINQ
ncbi:uncharacterized protein LOC111623459 [Centruroides sculpturatus]|uniref:uncharacterized protein LOC111623459 n=1 Tax=Centruroides sculpturatus TaxID=218467 RepID=UPI000C6D6667|nr:uncharacterized protein LOC111623459 [Centruroides sculpturatus]